MDIKAVFGFVYVPFTREQRTEDRYRNPIYDDAAQGILRAVEKRMSACLIAPAGCGKTTVARVLVDALPAARYRVHTVKVTDLGKRDMCREIAAVCGVPSAGSFPTLFRRVQEKFEEATGDHGLRPVLIVDEAHELRPDVLGMFRVLTNFNMDSKLVLSLVFLGQPGLSKLLERDDLDAVARRIQHYATLRSLSRDETAAYVAHRASSAGARTCPFDAGALDALYEIGRGNLRVTDSLALEALEAAARASDRVVAAQHIAAARKVIYPIYPS